jgi:carboxyl-terminal processing protease
MIRGLIGGRGIAVLAVVSGVACTPITLPPTDESSGISRHAAAETFAAGFTSIHDKYIEPVSLAELAVDGMRGLGSIDPALTVSHEGDAIVLHASNDRVAEFKAPVAGDAKAWAAVTTEVFAVGRRASTDLASSTIEQVYEAIFDGALSRLDAYSRYAGAEEAKRNRAKREGFGGVGLRFRVKDGVVRVTEVVAKTPAFRAGLRRHDRITHIDGIPTPGMDRKQVVDRIRGPVKTRVVLTVRRPGVAEPLRLEMKREHIVPATVIAHHEKGIVHLRVTGFNQETARSLIEQVEKSSHDLGPEMAGVVLDLRGNPGGLLKQSVRVADLFLAQGDIVNTRGRHPDSLQHYEAGGRDIAHGLPMVVLIDGKSASAAEIVAAALQDRRRAVVVGTTSFGKGTVQTVIRLPNEGEITITWSRLLAPSGYVLHRLGVLPGICISGSEANDDDAIAGVLVDGARDERVHTAWREVAPNDESGRRDLRATCPAERRRSPSDLEVARRLLADEVLFGRLLDRLGTTAAAQN